VLSSQDSIIVNTSSQVTVLGGVFLGGGYAAYHGASAGAVAAGSDDAIFAETPAVIEANRNKERRVRLETVLKRPTKPCILMDENTWTKSLASDPFLKYRTVRGA
jgi:hypothetical protein